MAAASMLLRVELWFGINSMDVEVKTPSRLVQG
jgi:hypothetical protein